MRKEENRIDSSDCGKRTASPAPDFAPQTRTHFDKVDFNPTYFSRTNLYPLSFMQCMTAIWSGIVYIGSVGGIGCGGMDCSHRTSAAATSLSVFPSCTHRSVAPPAIRRAAPMIASRIVTILTPSFRTHRSRTQSLDYH